MRYRVIILVAAGASIALAGAMKFVTMGLVMFFGVVVYPPILAIHLIAHSSLALSPQQDWRRAMRLALLSDGALIIAMLLQFDQTETTKWLTITRLYAQYVAHDRTAGNLWPSIGELSILPGILFLVPVAATWVLMFARARGARKASRDVAAERCPSCHYPIGSGALCPECGLQVAAETLPPN